MKKPIMSRETFNRISVIQSFVFVALILVLFFYNFGVATIPSASMYPTLKIHALTVFKIVPASELEYDDIAYFYFSQGDYSTADNGFKALINNTHDSVVYTKRVIGLPCDIMEIKDGHVWRNGELLDPDYIAEPMNASSTMEPYTVPDDAIFCMGDNRNNSADSRVYGAFPFSAFFGKNIFAINPPW